MSIYPRYKCNKEVDAVQILSVGYCQENGPYAVAVDDGFEKLFLGEKFFAKHEIQTGGYIVFYDDDYASYSPQKAFEEGYSLIGGSK